MGRAPCCDKANVKKGPWSPEEDAKLKDYIENNGTGGNWISLPQKAGLKRCGKSCRLRWLNYLRPNIRHGEFSDDEDRLICNLFANIGSRWSIIAAQLPGRTDNDIKNYWNTKLKKKLMGLSTNVSHKLPFNTSLNYPQTSCSPSLSPPSLLTSYNQISTPQNHLNLNNGPPNFSITQSFMGDYQMKEGVLKSSCSSSDDGGYLYNGIDDKKNLMISNYGEDASDYSGLEEIKQLISSNFCNNSNFFVDYENNYGEKIAYF